MKQTTLLILLIIALAFPVAAQAQLTTVSGTVHDYALQVLANHPYTITEVRRGGYIIPIRDATGYTDSLGVLTFQVPRSNFTTLDTTKVHFILDAPQYWNNGRGVWLIIPDAATADLSTLPPAAYLGPPGFAVVIPPAGGGYADSIHIADSLARLANTRVLSPLHADSIRIADSLARLARTEAAAAQDSARLANQRAGLIEAEIDTVQDAAVAALESEDARLRDSVAVRRAEIDALQQEQDAQDISIAAAGKWNQFDATGTSKIIAPKMSDSTKTKIDNLGNITTAGKVTATAGSANGKITLTTNASEYGTLSFGDGGNYIQREWNNFRYMADRHSFDTKTGGARVIFDFMSGRGVDFWNGTTSRMLTLTPDSLTIHKPTTFLGRVNIGSSSSASGVAINRNVDIPDSTLKAKTIQTSMLVIDTLNQFILDTLRFKQTFRSEGYTAGYAGLASCVTGYVDFEVRFGMAWNGTPIRFVFASDTASGVVMYSAEFSVFRVSSGWGASRTAWAAIPLGTGTIMYAHKYHTQNDAGASSVGGMDAASQIRRAGVTFTPYGAWSRGSQLFLRVYYAIPFGSGSANPVRVTQTF